MREISFEMAHDMGLIKYKDITEISDEEFKARRYHNLNEQSLEELYRMGRARAEQTKTVILEGETLKVIL